MSAAEPPQGANYSPAGGRGQSVAAKPRAWGDVDHAALAPEYVRKIARYVPGKPVEELAREYDLDPAAIIKLASNENPRGPSPKALAAIATAAAELTRYPDGNAFALKAALAAKFAIPPETIVLGNGSNDVLELVTHAFLRPGDHAVYAQHAFAVYPLATQARGATGIEVPAKSFGHDLAIGGGREPVAPRSEVLGDGTIRGEEPLRMTRRLEPLHAPLPLAGRLM